LKSTARFTALDAVEHDDGTLTAYVRGDIVGNWDGSTSFGRVIARRDYRAGFRARRAERRECDLYACAESTAWSWSDGTDLTGEISWGSDN